MDEVSKLKASTPMSTPISNWNDSQCRIGEAMKVLKVLAIRKVSAQYLRAEKDVAKRLASGRMISAVSGMTLNAVVYGIGEAIGATAAGC